MSGPRLSTRALVEGALLTALTVMLSFISIYVPLLGVFTSMFTAVPIIVLVVRQGLRVGIMSAVVSTFLVAILAQPYQAMVVLFAAGLVGLAIGGSIDEGWSPSKTIIIGAVAATIASAALLAISLLFLKVDPNKLSMDAMSDAFKTLTNMYSKSGMNKEQLAEINKTFTEGMKIVKVTVPGAMVLGGIVSTLLNFLMARAVLSRVGYKIDPLPQFRAWALPWYFPVLFMAGVALSTVLRHSPGIAWSFGINIVYFFGLICFLQGISVVTAFTARYNRLTVIAIIIALYFLNPVLLVFGLIWLGVLDPWVDFRKIRKNTNEPPINPQ